MVVDFTLDEINDAAKKFLSLAGNSKVIVFHGEMGAGKTTFIHAVCLALGVQDVTSSPTFSIINEYKSMQGERIYHMDLYRIRNEQEAIMAGVEDCLYSGQLCLVEWPEKAPGIFPDDCLHVYLQPTGNNRRKLQINL
jgi:tRNA threonylcarbamoyladenosine biosynthesis protein TsaE